ncbi:MAG: hypothetical protein ACJASB_001215 [Shewanella psychromarinicola]|jgi:hypothetical protein
MQHQSDSMMPASQRSLHPLKPNDLAGQLSTWLQDDAQRLHALHICRTVLQPLYITDWYIAAGFVRNLVWDKLHKFKPQPLNDIDVIYWCDINVSVERDRAIEAELRQRADLPWSVKNQARMHTKHGDPAYSSCLDAMSYWPEKQTAVGVKLVNVNVDNTTMLTLSSSSISIIEHDISVDAVFGLEGLFALTLCANPKRDISFFESRIVQKNWLTQYPKLTKLNEGK